MMRRSLLGIAVCAVALATSVSSHAATLEGLWQLEETTTAGPAVDSSGNGVNGTYTGAVDPTVLGPAGFGSAADFDGTGSGVSLGAPPTITSLLNNVSVEAWIKPDDLVDVQRIFTSNSGGISFGINGSGLRLTTFGVKDYEAGVGSGLIDTRQWQHVAAVMDASNDVTFYHNGNLIGTVEHHLPALAPGSYSIASRGATESFDGKIDEVAVFSGTLTAEEIREHFTAGATGGRTVGLPYSETFDTDAADTTAFFGTYPDFTNALGGDGGAIAIGGHMELSGAIDSVPAVPGFRPPAGGSLVIEADIGASASNGSYNVGLYVGQNRIVFHPGYTVAPGGVRVEGPGGFGTSSMGFVPANGSLHHFRVEQFDSGLFEVEITDADNPANVYTTSFTNPGSVGGAIGFRKEGNAAQMGLYDNLTITPQFPPPPTGFHYSFSDATVLPTLVDQDPGGHDGTASAGAALSADVPTIGVPAGAGNRSLNSAAGGAATIAIDLLENTKIEQAGGFTMEAWFKHNGGDGSAFNKILDYAGTDGLVVDDLTGDVRFRINSDPVEDSFFGPVTSGQWHYVAVVFDTQGNSVVPDPARAGEVMITGVADLYMDGVLVDSTGPLTINGFGDELDRVIGIGQHPFGGDKFNGLVFEPRVTLGVLSAAQLQYVPEPASLVLLAFAVMLGTPMLARRRRAC